MDIVIPTMGRINQQDTWESLKGSGYSIVLACPEDEVASHEARGRPVLPIPNCIQGIAATRHAILETCGEKVVMMDDDLTFAVRREDEPDKFRPAKATDITEMLRRLSSLLDTYGHASIAMREGGNRQTKPVLHCSRVARVIAYRKKAYFASGADFRNSTVMDDFEVTLHMLTRGWKSAILNTHVQNQRSSGAPGGASLYRDLAMHADAARKLASRYPKFVKAVQKTTKTAWGGATRTDVLVQWKKAYESGVLLYGEQKL